MPLYIKDEEVASLARKAMLVTKTKTITETVRLALLHEIARARDSLPPSARLAPAIAMAAALGPFDPDFDMKTFSDELWGE